MYTVKAFRNIFLDSVDIGVSGHCPQSSPDSKVHGANMGSIWGRQDPGGPHVGPMNFVIWEASALRSHIHLKVL